MKRPEEDLENRRVIWDAMHLLWLDTDVDEFYFQDVAIACANSPYSLDELEKIYWSEVYTCMRHNLWGIAGEWQPCESNSLAREILKRHRFGKTIWFKQQRKYAFEYWKSLSDAVALMRRTREL